MIHSCKDSPSIPLSFKLAFVVPRRSVMRKLKTTGYSNTILKYDDFTLIVEGWCYPENDPGLFYHL